MQTETVILYVVGYERAPLHLYADDSLSYPTRGILQISQAPFRRRKPYNVAVVVVVDVDCDVAGVVVVDCGRDGGDEMRWWWGWLWWCVAAVVVEMKVVRVASVGDGGEGGVDWWRWSWWYGHIREMAKIKAKKTRPKLSDTEKKKEQAHTSSLTSKGMTRWQSRAILLIGGVELTWQAMDGLDQIGFEAVSDQRMRLKAEERLEGLEGAP
ncbi:hypothetical protein Tco_0898454 [Tanacetum coccineum]